MLLVSQLTDQASDIHTCARAMRHHKPQLSKPNHMAQAATALLKTAASSINDVTKQLRAADFAGGAMDGAAVAAALHKAVDNLQHTVSDMHQMTTNMSTGHAELDSLQGQYHSVVLAVQHAREAVLSAAAMLADATADQSAKHHSTAAHAHIGGYLQDAQHGASESGSGALSEALQQLQEAEHQLVSCIENIRAVSGGVVAGDESFIAADIAAQEVLTSLMKICALLSGPGVIEAAVAKKDVGVVRTWLAVAEGRIAEKLKVVRRFISDVCKCHHALLQYEQQIPQACIALSSTSAGSHECPHLLHSAPACVSAAYVCQPQVAYCCADVVQIVASFHTTLSSSLHAFSAVAKHLSAGHQGATKVVTLMRQLEALLSVTPQVASGSMSGNDVAALKVELAAAKHTVECQERHIQQLVARDKQLLGGECCCLLLSCTGMCHAFWGPIACSTSRQSLGCNSQITVVNFKQSALHVHAMLCHLSCQVLLSWCLLNYLLLPSKRLTQSRSKDKCCSSTYNNSVQQLVGPSMCLCNEFRQRSLWLC